MGPEFNDNPTGETDMQHFKHYNEAYIFLRRDYDKCVFGEWKAVSEVRKIRQHNVRIHGGMVQIKFRGKWCEVAESHPEGTDWSLGVIREMAEERGEPYPAPVASVRLA